MYIPGDLIPTLMSYMDPETLSIMAATCKSWKLLVYRTSVWKDFTWRPRHAPFFYRTVVPSPFSRHVGEPSILCFLSWITQVLHNPSLQEALPLRILAVAKPTHFVKDAYKHWRSLQNPCTIPHHHRWSDVCVFRSALPTISSEERYKTKVLIVNPCDKTSDNAYANWIEHRIYDIQAIPTNPPLLDEVTSAFVNNLVTTANKQTLERLEVIHQLKKTLLVNYEISRQALRAYSPNMFHTFDMVVKHNPIDMYDAAILSYSKPS